MPQKSWAVGEEVLAADFNNYVQNQTVPAFATTTERDAQYVSPPNGAVCITLDTGATWQRIGGLWWRPNQMIGAAYRTTDFGFTGTGDTGVLTLSSVTFPAGRKIRLDASWAGANAAATTDTAYLKLKEGSTTYNTCRLNFATFQSNGGEFHLTFTPGSGARGVALVAAGSTAGNYNLQANGMAVGISLELWDAGAA